MMKSFARKKRLRRRNEAGSTTVEAVGALIILCFILFAMLQIYRWCITRQTCQYSAYYSTKALSLGYKNNFALRSARAAGINISGPNEGSGDNDASAVKSYMIYGDASGVRYAYWHNHGKDQPYLDVWYRYQDDDIASTVILRNEKLIHQNIFSGMIPLSRNPEPGSTVYSRNYSQIYLEK